MPPTGASLSLTIWYCPGGIPPIPFFTGWRMPPQHSWGPLPRGFLSYLRPGRVPRRHVLQSSSAGRKLQIVRLARQLRRLGGRIRWELCGPLRDIYAFPKLQWRLHRAQRRRWKLRCKLSVCRRTCVQGGAMLLGPVDSVGPLRRMRGCRRVHGVRRPGPSGRDRLHILSR